MDSHISSAAVLDELLVSDLNTADQFNDEFIKSCPATKNGDLTGLWLDTKLGPMFSVANDDGICLLEFFDRRALLGEVRKLRAKNKSIIAPGERPSQTLLRQELTQYYAGRLQEFTVPVWQHGTPFQMMAWEHLRRIPYGETRSYQDQAVAIGYPAAHRAVANANGCNQIAVIFPCHRIIRSDGSLGGYGGRVVRKQWLLDLERGIL